MLLTELVVRMKENAQIRQTNDRAVATRRVREVPALPGFAERVLANLLRCAFNQGYVLRVAGEQADDALAERYVGGEVERPLQIQHRSVQVDDVGLDSRAEYELAHPRTAHARIVPVMHSGAIFFFLEGTSS